VEAACEHGASSHDGTVPSVASAPEASRAWLLIEHPGPWPHEPAEAWFPGPLRGVVSSAVALGVRVQLIRRPGSPGSALRRQPWATRSVFAGWTAGRQPWLRHGTQSAAADALAGPDLERLASGRAIGFGSPAGEPLYLVCAHAQRNACCARFGGPLAVSLAARYPERVYQTTHVGGHRFAANLVILPHGLYYGPVGLDAASAAISAYERGAVTAGRYRGRAGQPQSTQQAEHDLLTRAGSLAVAALA
jgi:hypothetical protein